MSNNGNTALVQLQAVTQHIQQQPFHPSRELAVSLVNAAAQALADANSAGEVKDIRNKLRLFEHYFKMQGAKLVEGNLIVAQRIRTEHKLGQMLAKILEGHGGGDQKSVSRDSKPIGKIPDGVSAYQSSSWQWLATLDLADVEALLEQYDRDNLGTTMFVRWAKTEYAEQQRQANRQIIESSPSMTEVIEGQRFSTIVLDPPWDWGDEGDIDQLGRAKPLYDTMGIDEIAALPIDDYADENSHLYLWITNRSLPKGFRLLDEWGFRYVTCLTWCKPSYGMGNYFRGQSEHVLFGVKGSLLLLRNDVGTVIHAPRGKQGHSSKPKAFYDLVESCSPAPYLELFAREPRRGWVTVGAEA